MRDNLIATVLAVLGFAVLAGYFMMTRPDTISAAAIASETDRPYLVIEIAGEANGEVVVELFSDIAPLHAERLITLANSGEYDNVVFHRVIDRFMAQTGDVQFGKADGDLVGAGRGDSELPNLPAEFSDTPFDRGVVGMARTNNPNSANSQFFIMFESAPHLNGQYTVVGQVVEGMDVVDAIKRGAGRNGEVTIPADVMRKVTVSE